MPNLLQPSSTEELRDIIADAADSGTPLHVLGNGTKSGLGPVSQATDVLSTAALTGILFYEPEELVLAVRAGTALAEIENVLAKSRQQLAFEPPRFQKLLNSNGNATIGGVVATGLSGPRRPVAGAVRDHVLGFTGVNGRGEIIKSGGRVVKNVTGYDLSKLVTGSYGTLAVLSEIILKTLPRPERTATLVARSLTAHRGSRLLSKALGSAFAVSGAVWLPAELAGATGDGQSACAIRLEGSAESLTARITSLRTMLDAFFHIMEDDDSRDFWYQIGNAEMLNTENRAIWRVSVPPMSGPDILDAMPGAIGFMDWGGGLVWLSVPETGDCAARRLRAAISKVGGHATLFCANKHARSTVPVFQPLEGPMEALTCRVKESFDPLHILNRGRMYAGI